MKSLSILIILLVSIIAIAHAMPMQNNGEKIIKRKLGATVQPLGVRFKDLYAGFNSQVKKVNEKFDKEIKKFNVVVPKAAAADGTDPEDVKWLIDWNGKYKALVDDLETTTTKLDKSIQKLDAKLKA